MSLERPERAEASKNSAVQEKAYRFGKAVI